MPVITLTTDLGTKDHYVASIKGAIYSQCPEARVVDISHDVHPFDILQASFLIKNCYLDFPKGSIHVIGINPEWNENTRHLVIEADDHYFIGADNGIFSLIFEKKPTAIFELNVTSDSEYNTFPTKDVFVKAACHIANNGSLPIIGKETENYEERGIFSAVPETTLIKGMAMYVDHYGNVISNISEKLFKQYQGFSSFRIILRREDYDISKIASTYNQVPEGERLALFSSTGYLEIAINKGNASKLLGIKQNDIIRVEFND